MIIKKKTFLNTENNKNIIKSTINQKNSVQSTFMRVCFYTFLKIFS